MSNLNLLPHILRRNSKWTPAPQVRAGDVRVLGVWVGDKMSLESWEEWPHLHRNREAHEFGRMNLDSNYSITS